MRSRGSYNPMAWHPLAVAALVCAVMAPTAGAQPAAVPCAVPEQVFVRSQHFAELQVQALELNQENCLAFIQGDGGDTEADRRARFLAFGLQTRTVAAAAFSDLAIADITVPFDHFVGQLAGIESFGTGLPELRVERGDSADDWLIFHFDDPARSGRLPVASDNAACRSRFNANCDQVLKDLAAAVNYYKYAAETLSAAATVEKLNRMSDQWDRFLDRGRSQTLLDLGLTTVLERQNLNRGYLVPPPKRQWALLHPSLAYEHVSGAPSGESDSLTFVVEWFGVNWWGDDSPLGRIPFGVSIASVHGDRAGIASAGHGLLLHFDNKYSLGWTRRHGADGFYFSIDLVRLIDNKRERLERYRRRLRQSR
jgi:hypothetical protein